MERNLEPAAGPAPRGAWSCAVVAGMSLVRSISALRHRRHPPLAQCAELPRRVKTCRGIACACVPPRAAARDTRLNQPNCRVRLILDSSEARACGRLASFRLTRALPSRAFRGSRTCQRAPARLSTITVLTSPSQDPVPTGRAYAPEGAVGLGSRRARLAVSRTGPTARPEAALSELEQVGGRTRRVRGG